MDKLTELEDKIKNKISKWIVSADKELKKEIDKLEKEIMILNKDSRGYFKQYY